MNNIKRKRGRPSRKSLLEDFNSLDIESEESDVDSVFEDISKSYLTIQKPIYQEDPDIESLNALFDMTTEEFCNHVSNMVNMKRQREKELEEKNCEKIDNVINHLYRLMNENIYLHQQINNFKQNYESLVDNYYLDKK